MTVVGFALEDGGGGREEEGGGGDLLSLSLSAFADNIYSTPISGEAPGEMAAAAAAFAQKSPYTHTHKTQCTNSTVDLPFLSF